jgi:hypothetical protein
MVASLALRPPETATLISALPTPDHPARPDARSVSSISRTLTSAAGRGAPPAKSSRPISQPGRRSRGSRAPGRPGRRPGAEAEGGSGAVITLAGGLVGGAHVGLLEPLHCQADRADVGGGSGGGSALVTAEASRSTSRQPSRCGAGSPSTSQWPLLSASSRAVQDPPAGGAARAGERGTAMGG